MSNQFKYVNGLNTIRFIAVILVIIGHWGIYYERGTVQFDAIRVLIPWGKFGLAFFLVLSGFLISSVLFKARRDMAEGDSKPGIIKNFLMRRALRLLPAYYFMIILLYLLGYAAVHEHPWYYLMHISNILIYRIQTNNPLIHLWSLSVQEQFYLILPWFILYVPEKALKYVIYGAIAIGLGTKYYTMFVLNKPFTFLFFHFLDCLGLGVLYAYYMYIGKKEKFESAIKFMLPVLIYLGWQMAARFKGTVFGVIYERSMWSMMGLGIIIWTINNKNQLLNKYFFENKVMNYFGKISYGIYLYHYPIGSYFDYYFDSYKASHHLPFILTNFIFIYVVKFCLVLLVASLSYNYLETPIIELKKKFNYLKNKDGKKPVAS